MFDWFKSKKKSGNISEPVHSIVKTFDERARWKMKSMHRETGYASQRLVFIFTDSKTNEVCYMFADREYWCNSLDTLMLILPCSFKYNSPLPTWMTEEEKEYVISEVNKRMKVLAERIRRVEDRRKKKSEAKSKIEQTKERQRVMGVYCK